jgi:hypothetical protein
MNRNQDTFFSSVEKFAKIRDKALPCELKVHIPVISHVGKGAPKSRWLNLSTTNILTSSHQHNTWHQNNPNVIQKISSLYQIRHWG